MKASIQSVESYIDSYPENIREKLKLVRQLIITHAPGAVEGISYGMPSYKLNKKPLVYFAAFEKHIGFYATPTGHEAFAVELKIYVHGKGSVQFPLNEPLPEDLIVRMVKFRVKENSAG